MWSWSFVTTNSNHIEEALGESASAAAAALIVAHSSNCECVITNSTPCVGHTDFSLTVKTETLPLQSSAASSSRAAAAAGSMSMTSAYRCASLGLSPLCDSPTTGCVPWPKVGTGRVDVGTLWMYPSCDRRCVSYSYGEC